MISGKAPLGLLLVLLGASMVAGLTFPPVHAASPSTVGTTGTNSYGLGYSADGFTCGASGRFWVFYNNDTSYGWKSSTDGQTWSSWTGIASSVPPPPAGTDGLAFWCSDTTVYYAGGKQSGSDANFYYDSGTLNADGSISWAAEAPVPTRHGTVGFPTITLDSNGDAWVAVQTLDASGNTYIEIYQHSISWTLSQAFQFTGAFTPFPQVIALQGGDMALTYGQPVASSPIYVATYSGGAWTLGPSTSASYEFIYSASVATGNTVDACVTDGTSVYLLTYAYGALSWSSPKTLAAGTSCSLATDGASLLGAFYVSTPTTIAYQQSGDGGSTFASPVTLSSAESGVSVVGAGLRVSNDPAKQAMAVWLSNSPSTNSVKFANVSTAPVIQEQVTITPSNGGPTGYAAVSGCHASVASIPMDGSPHAVGADPSCNLTFSVPSDTLYTRYRFPGTASAWTYTTGAGSSESKSNTVYYQFAFTASYSLSGAGAPPAPALTSTQTGGGLVATLTGAPTVYWLDSGAAWGVPPSLTSGATTWTTAPSSGTVTGPTIMAFVYSQPITSTATSTTTTTLISSTTTTVTSTSTLSTATVTSTSTSTSTVTDTTTKSTTLTTSITVTSTTTVSGQSAVPSASSLTCDQTTLHVNQRVTCTDLVSTADAGLASGSVAWTTSGGGAFGREICNLQSGEDQLRCQVQYTPSVAGVQRVTATYSGDLYHSSSSGAAVVFVGNTASSKVTALSLMCDQTYVQLGQSTNCEATVDTADGRTASGTVTWSASDLGTFSHVKCNPPDRNGQLQCSARYTPNAIGAQVVSASYAGDSSHLSSAGAFEVFVQDAGSSQTAQQAVFLAPVGAILAGGTSVVVLDARRIHGRRPKAAWES